VRRIWRSLVEASSSGTPDGGEIEIEAAPIACLLFTLSPLQRRLFCVYYFAYSILIAIIFYIFLIAHI